MDERVKRKEASIHEVKNGRHQAQVERDMARDVLVKA